MVVVFANTGDEKEPTLKFVKQCDDYFNFNLVWVEGVTNPEHNKGISARVVTFETASRHGEPFEAAIAKHGIPNMTNPHCSRDLKGATIKSYLRSIGWIGSDYVTAIGIRADEPERIDFESAKKNRLIYPLVTNIRTTGFNINSFWSKMPFDLELKSYEGNCGDCWKKSLRKLMTIAVESPDTFCFSRRMEVKYENFIPESRQHNTKIKTPIRFFRDNMSVDDIFEEAKFPFKKAEDESKLENSQKELFSDWNEYYDGNGGCVESCEAFIND